MWALAAVRSFRRGQRSTPNREVDNNGGCDEKKTDNKYTAKNLLGITPENFLPIYFPIFISIIILVLGVIIFTLNENKAVFSVFFGLTGVIMSLSGLGQIKLKEVPGFPFLKGISAVIFGIVYFLVFMILGFVVIFYD